MRPDMGCCERGDGSCNFFLFIVAARYHVPHSSGWVLGVDGEECCVSPKSDGLFMSILVSVPQATLQIVVLELLDGPSLDEVLHYVVFERAEEIDWCADDSIGSFFLVLGIASVHAVPVFHQESNMSAIGGARRVNDKYVAVELSLGNHGKMTRK